MDTEQSKAELRNVLSSSANLLITIVCVLPLVEGLASATSARSRMATGKTSVQKYLRAFLNKTYKTNY